MSLNAALKDAHERYLKNEAENVKKEEEYRKCVYRFLLHASITEVERTGVLSLDISDTAMCEIRSGYKVFQADYLDHRKNDQVLDKIANLLLFDGIHHISWKRENNSSVTWSLSWKHTDN